MPSEPRYSDCPYRHPWFKPASLIEDWSHQLEQSLVTYSFRITRNDAGFSKNGWTKQTHDRVKEIGKGESVYWVVQRLIP